MAKKLYYTIGEVAKLLNVKTSAIRFWEKEFPHLRSKRTSNRRVYTEKDVNKIRFVHYLLKEKRYTLEGAKQILKNSSKKQQIEREFLIIQKLEKIRNFLVSLRENL